MISAADAGFQNIWSLQSCIDTLYEFGSEEQRQKYIPRVCAGEGMSMDLKWEVWSLEKLELHLLLILMQSILFTPVVPGGKAEIKAKLSF